MDRLRRLPVALRVSLITSVVLAISLGVGVQAFRSALRHAQVAELDQDIDRQVKTLRLVAAEDPIPVRLPTVRDSPLFCQIVSSTGKVLGASANVSDMNLMVPVDSAVMKSGQAKRMAATIDGVDVRLTKAGVTTSAGASWILVAAPLNALRRADTSLVRQLRVIAPILVVLAGLGVWFVANRALRPVDLLRRQVEVIGSSNFTARVTEPKAEDEVGRLARTMNGLLQRVEESHTRQSRFVSDASHELRSPLATVRTRLEVALRSPKRTDWLAVAETSLRQTSRMERLVDDLLLLARTDTAVVASAMPVDLDELIREEVGFLRTTSVMPLDTSRVSAGRVLGRPDDLRRVIVNLTTNAMSFASSSVQLSLRSVIEGTNRSGVQFIVDDDGPGVAPAQRERIFDRFTQLDESRVKSANRGAGLGLAIVADVVHRHHGTVTVDDSPLGGARFTVTLPPAD